MEISVGVISLALLFTASTDNTLLDLIRCSASFINCYLSGTHHSDLLLISTTALYCKMSFPVYYDHMFI